MRVDRAFAAEDDPLNHTKKHQNQKCFLSLMNRPNQTACGKVNSKTQHQVVSVFP